MHVRIEPRLSVNDNGLVLAAARRGLGLCYVSRRQIEQDLYVGVLETTLAGIIPQSDGLFLYYPNRAQALPKLRLFIDFLRARLAP